MNVDPLTVISAADLLEHYREAKRLAAFGKRVGLPSDAELIAYRNVISGEIARRVDARNWPGTS